MQEVPERHITSSLSSFDEFSRRYQVLLQTADPVTRQALPELFDDLLPDLRGLDFEPAGSSLHAWFKGARLAPDGVHLLWQSDASSGSRAIFTAHSTGAPGPSTASALPRRATGTTPR